MQKLLILSISTFSICNTALADDKPVSTREGPVAGTTVNGIRAFKGIPYAAPPVGNLRWKPPQPVTSWKEVRPASEFAPICIQPGPRGASFYGSEGPRKIVQSEDCLYLNVWSAAAEKPAKRPVLLWIHGGGMQAGSSSNPTYDGANLARKDAVVVTVGYRLGALGFLAHPELSAESERHVSGNYGILDLIASLQWVKRNIAQFGGDPGNVTIFGQSGGSWGVCYLVASPLAKGLFHRGIGESGCTFDRDPHLNEKWLDYDPAEKIGQDWVTRVFSEKLSLEALRAKPAASFGKFISATANIDGWVFPSDIYSIYKQNKQNPVPIMGGNTADEGTVVTVAMPETNPAGYEAYLKQLRKTYGDELTQDLAKQYKLNGEADVRRVTEEVFRDSRQVWQMRMLARLSSATHHPFYLYYFTHVPPGQNSERMGAYHAAEVPYVFGNFVDTRRPYAELDHKLSETIQAYWLNFAKTGNPNGPGLPEWPKFDKSTELCQDLGDVVKTIPAPNKEALAIFDRYEAPRLGKEK